MEIEIDATIISFFMEIISHARTLLSYNARSPRHTRALLSFIK